MMQRAAAARWLNRAMRAGETAQPPSRFLNWRSSGYFRSDIAWPKAWAVPTPRCRATHHKAADDNTTLTSVSEPDLRPLPVTCSGCGAFTQTRDSSQLGYVDTASQRVQTWMQPKARRRGPLSNDDKLVQQVLQSVDAARLEELGLTPFLMLSAHEEELDAKRALKPPPVCERCHSVAHHSSTGNSPQMIHHPTVESLRETIEESPHKYNHIYHIVDAADFPMSLIPQLHVLLGDIPLRSRNRRAPVAKYRGSRQIEMSFIITRSDLLAPGQAMVDAMVPQLREALRDALGPLGNKIRLGNLRCVSAKKGWWTKTVLDEIFKRGGGGWLVGKINVGKSALFSAIFPKGRMIGENSVDGPFAVKHSQSTAPADSMAETEIAEKDTTEKSAALFDSAGKAEAVEEQDDRVDLKFGELLPPLRPEVNYPEMPLVSLVPGTTASPIRIPFGSGKGELIDLPGLTRSELPLFVKEEHRKSLVMRQRIVPRQHSVTYGDSLILGGGLIRIAPRTPNLTFLMYNFTPLDDHLTSTEKALASLNEPSDHKPSRAFNNIIIPEAKKTIRLARMIKLEFDVTKKRAGPLTRKDAVGLAVEKLPFRVLSVNILIEGVGYVEVVTQVREHEYKAWRLKEQQAQEAEISSRGADALSVSDDPIGQIACKRKDFTVKREPGWPAVDVYTPEGRFVAWRMPLGGWLLNKPPENPKPKQKRRSMKGQKKAKKREKRAKQKVVKAAESLDG